MEEGVKFDKEKTRQDLVPAFAQEQFAKVLTFGAKKYAPHNWENGMKWSRIIGAILRHTFAILRGEDYDPETGLLHSAHIMCEASFLTEYYRIYPQGDDRELKVMKPVKIGLDIDDVLSDFCPAFCKRFYLKPFPESWTFDRNIGEKFNTLKKEKSFWLSIPRKTDPSTIPFEPTCYITSRSIPKEWTERWLDKNGFPPVPVYQVGIDGSKVEIAKNAGIEMFIDDRYENFVELTAAGIFTYLFDAPHNQRYDVGHRRIKSLSEIFSNNR